ncbi:MAG TPA: YtxH domain-containing protein [Gemmatimonadota bacterium]|nr:YtxH domain-containing protein [Gemmatimonadota bacterium]
MSQENETPVVVVKKSSGFGAFLFGALCGAAAGILFAPRSGEETQRELREGALRLRSDAEGKLGELRDELVDVYERAREDVSERVDLAREEVRHRRHRAEEAVRAGKTAARGARSDLERRLQESKRAYRESLAKDEDREGRPAAEAGEGAAEAEEAEAGSEA